MELSKYEITASETLMVFEFNSEGPHGIIPKIVRFSKTNLKDIYNLGFGDKDSITGDLDDRKISNNGDSQKVLATVVSTLYAFTEKYPDFKVAATGSTRSRTRLYRMGITKYYSAIIKDFEVYGLYNHRWVIFQKEIEYDAFLVKRKIVV